MSEIGKTQKHDEISRYYGESRFADHFDYFGDASIHFGSMIDCVPGNEADRASGASCGC